MQYYFNTVYPVKASPRIPEKGVLWTTGLMIDAVKNDGIILLSKMERFCSTHFLEVALGLAKNLTKILAYLSRTQLGLL
jgi:hypothetical protein